MGELEDANGVMINMQDCGDVVMFFIKVENMVLKKVHFLVQGCHNLIACCSMLTLFSQGKNCLGCWKLPLGKLFMLLMTACLFEEMHTANYACDALYGAIQNYLDNAKKKANPELHRSMMGDGWRSLYIQQHSQHNLENLYQKRKKNAQ